MFAVLLLFKSMYAESIIVLGSCRQNVAFFFSLSPLPYLLLSVFDLLCVFDINDLFQSDNIFSIIQIIYSLSVRLYIFYNCYDEFAIIDIIN